MLTMIGAADALGLVLQHARPSEPSSLSPEAGLVLARAVLADRDYPPFDRATMDGYAVRVAHAGKTVAVRGEARPGVVSFSGPDDDECMEIMTGAPCPPGTEAVVMNEEVRRDGGHATFPSGVVVGQNIVRAGAECRRGAAVLPEGASLTPLALGLLATVGESRVLARTLPSLALLVTGDEVVHGGGRPGDVEIRDSNGPTLAAMARAARFPSPTHVSVRDTPDAIAVALETSSADVVVLTGGVSAGNYDLVPAALAAHGATIVFHKVRQQPGKPLLFAVKGSRLFFGLPGTPLGCHLGFHRYVLPAMRALAALPAPREERGRLVASWSTRSDRQQFLLARAERGEGAWDLTLSYPKGSSDLFTAWGANAYVSIPEGIRALATGAAVSFEWLAEAS
jgi:molybdopterin molybdotransferase